MVSFYVFSSTWVVYLRITSVDSCEDLPVTTAFTRLDFGPSLSVVKDTPSVKMSNSDSTDFCG